MALLRFSPPLSSLAVVLVAPWWSTGCTAPVDSATAPLAVASWPIADGYDDVEDTAVVGINWLAGGTLCTGSLISPTVVLTARHCVSDTLGTVEGGVSCGQTTFGPLGGADDFLVSTAAQITADNADEFLVGEVVGVPDGEEFCGNDVAILILAEQVSAGVAVPLLPRLDAPLQAGDPYSAIGYGATSDAGDGAGTRRRRDDLFVSCVADDCPPDQVTGTEWVGDTGICNGDSGGPAIDLDSSVVGVTSRGAVGCDAPVYGHVYSWREWIKNTAVHAAGLGTYEPPAWTAGATTDPHHSAPVGDECSTDDDCYTQLCLPAESGSYCTRPCTAAAPCPDDYECDPVAAVCRAVVPEPPTPVGQYDRPSKRGTCAQAASIGRSSSSRAFLAWSLLLAAFGLARWRRQPRSADGALCAAQNARSTWVVAAGSGRVRCRAARPRALPDGVRQ